MIARILTDPNVQTRIPLKSGRELWVTPQEHNLLKGGFYATMNSPWRKRQLIDLLKRIYANYNFNAYQMTEDLFDAFPNVKEYERRDFYKWFPPLRTQNKQERRISEALDRVLKEADGNLDAIRKALWKKVAPEPEETLGTVQPVEARKHRKASKDTRNSHPSEDKPKSDISHTF